MIKFVVHCGGLAKGASLQIGRVDLVLRCPEEVPYFGRLESHETRGGNVSCVVRDDVRLHAIVNIFEERDQAMSF